MAIGLFILVLAALPVWLLWLFVRKQQSATNKKPGRPTPSSLTTVLLYALAGPALGAIPWLLMVFSMSTVSASASFSLQSLVGMGFFLFFAYVLGIVPALLCGLIYAYVEHRYWQKSQGPLPVHLATTSAGISALCAGFLSTLILNGFKFQAAGTLPIILSGIFASVALAILKTLYSRKNPPEFNA